jgi:division protein CdvB (Snf7/Vps24/ESCRT-III family)
MKTIYTLLILLLSFTVANAQEQTSELKVVTVNELNVNTISSEITIEFSNNIQEAQTNVIENKESNTTNEVIARSSSDIKIYLNRVRNVQNINLLFPKIYKEIVA